MQSNVFYKWSLCSKLGKLMEKNCPLKLMKRLYLHPNNRIIKHPPFFSNSSHLSAKTLHNFWIFCLKFELHQVKIFQVISQICHPLTYIFCFPQPLLFTWNYHPFFCNRLFPQIISIPASAPESITPRVSLGKRSGFHTKQLAFTSKSKHKLSFHPTVPFWVEWYLPAIFQPEKADVWSHSVCSVIASLFRNALFLVLSTSCSEWQLLRTLAFCLKISVLFWYKIFNVLAFSWLGKKASNFLLWENVHCLFKLFGTGRSSGHFLRYPC